MHAYANTYTDPYAHTCATSHAHLHACNGSGKADASRLARAKETHAHPARTHAHTHARTLPHAVQVDTIGMRTEQPDGTRRPRPPLAIPAFPLNVRLSCLAYLACPSVGARAQKHLVSVCVCVGRTCKRPSVRKILILDSHKRLTGSKRRKRIVSAPWTWTYRPIAVLLHKCCVTMRPMRPTGRLR
jgi:hypothetical protein